jgi:hypothetical protein
LQDLDVLDLIENTLNLRSSILKLLSKRQQRRVPCSELRFIVITEYAFGRSGNNMIEFTHGLWLAEKLNATLVVPKWMSHILIPFDSNLLSQAYCFVDSSVWKNNGNFKIIEVTSEDSFFTFKLFNDNDFKHFLPPLNDVTVDEISTHFCKVYALLWSSPSKKLLEAGIWVIKNLLHGNFRYTAAHKRQLEGACSRLLADRTKPSDFSPAELPMDRIEWKGALHRSHPLCDMSIEFLKSVQQMHNRTDSKLFIAYDGRGEIQSYIDQNATFSHFIQNNVHHKTVDLRFIDMFIAIHSDLFILNPYSTFSWEIFIVRVCLGLISLPIIQNNDFYLHKQSDIEAAKRPLWVSWKSILYSFQHSADKF